MKKAILNCLFLFTCLSIYGQKIQNKIEFENFYQKSISPIIHRDTTRLSEVILFPVSGVWAVHFGMGNPEKEWQQQEFFKNINSFITERVKRELINLKFEDLEYNDKLGFTELVVSIDTSDYPSGNNEVQESSLIFFFKLQDNVWKLHSVGIAG